MKRIKTFVFSLLLMSLGAEAQPAYDMQRIQHEDIARGLVCVRQGDEVIISWRLLSDDSPSTAFNIYANGKKLNSQPVANTTFFATKAGKKNVTYRITTVEDGKETHRKDGEYTLKADSPELYLSIPLLTPQGGKSPDGREYWYNANDASVGDIDGDGEYEIIIKWEPSNAHDNSHEGYTGNVLIDCYKIPGIGHPSATGTAFQWRIDLGKNIRAGAHYTQFLVYDFDGDGKSELICKTADGTRDGKGVVIGDSTVDWRTDDVIDNRIAGKSADRQRHVSGRILRGPEYLTVFSGATGEALKTVNYIQPRGNVGDWGDTYGNRCDRFLACVAYLDGVHPSAVMCRGYYTKTYLAAFDWNGTDLTLRWLFDSEKVDKERRQKDPYALPYSGQGNHNLRVGDVDGDGCDEITYGSMAVDNDGTGLYTTGMGHGDAIHLMPFYPDSTTLQLWDVHENRKDGSDFRDARTGRIIFQIPSRMDVGRGMAADIDPTCPGVEMWSVSQKGYYDVKGNHHELDAWIPINSAVWWDGDLLREMLDHNEVSKYNWTEKRMDRILQFEGCSFNNGTKSNPCLAADILGDWREEVIVRDRQNTELRIYTTTIPTGYRFPCWMHDIIYRLSVAIENVGYNQPREPGIYFGAETKPTK